MRTSGHTFSRPGFASNSRRKGCGSQKALLTLAAILTAAPLIAQYGDAQAGAETLERRECTLCHSVSGAGGDIAPDLARRSTERFTPATLTAMFWNHGPTMWSAMQERGVEIPELTPAEVLDLYAYFFAIRYFEPHGDAARGKRVFASKSCNRCHALGGETEGFVGPPVSQWPSVTDPVLWTQEMWNHGSEMAAEFAKQGIPWPEFTVQEMADLMVYVRNLPGLPSRTPALQFGEISAGEDVFHSHNCLECHTFGVSAPGAVDLAAVSRRERSLTGLAVAMWNHRPIMDQAAAEKGVEIKPFEGKQMRELVAYLFEENFFGPTGDANSGEKKFRGKRCDSCHGQPGTGAPALRGTGGGFTAPVLAAAVWRHGPAMLKSMQERGIAWPTLTGEDVADIMAFLNAR